MPIYEYQCEKCKKIKEIFRHKVRPLKKVVCDCGGVMSKLISLSNTNVKENPRYSKAMGVNVTQVEEARKLWPDAVFNEQGDLLITNRKEKKKWMKRRGMIELD